MKKAKRCLVMILAAVFIVSTAPMALAADALLPTFPVNDAPLDVTPADSPWPISPTPPVPGGSVPFCTNAGTTVQAVLKHLDLVEGWVGLDENSTTPLDAGEVVATGMVAHGPGRDTPIAVLGDVLGTGKVGLSQLIKLAQVFTNVQPALTGEFLMAGDLNENGIIDIADLTKLALYIVTGQMPNTIEIPTPPTDLMEIAPVARKPLIDPWEAGKDEQAEEAAKGANDFAFRLSSVLLDQQTDQNANFVCSPYSVWLPLAALVNATDEAKRPELIEAIGAAGLSAADINTAASRMLYGLTGSRQNKWYADSDLPKIDPLKIANAIFVDRDKVVNPQFASVFANDYLGDSISVDFSSGEAADAVNQWCSDNTDGLIPEIIKEFDPSTVAAIANAIYFSDRWDWEFNPEDTKNDVFHSPTGDMTAPFMLREADGLSYYEDEDVQAMPLRFANDGGLAVILPKDGDARSLLNSLTDERLTDIVYGTQPRSGKLLLPRFDISSDAMDLMGTLSALGVPLLDAQQPAITKLLENADPLYITDALQSAKIKVDEKGTTAAAVTIMAMAEGAFMPQPTEKFEMNCNRPFVFVLYGNTYDGGAQVLFTGIVNQPEAA